jgi:hypothetical protein
LKAFKVTAQLSCAIVAARPVAWLTGKLAIYEGSSLAGGFGLTTAFESGGGYTLVGGAGSQGISLPSETMRVLVDAIHGGRLDQLDEAVAAERVR